MSTVLVVDDAVIMRMSLKKIIEKAGHEVAGEAGNGEEALEIYKKLKPDLVTMDITMPDVDGYEGLKLIKEFDSEAKVIMITSIGQKASVIKTLQDGAKGFIVKPFDEEQVIQSINKVLKKN